MRFLSEVSNKKIKKTSSFHQCRKVQCHWKSVLFRFLVSVSERLSSFSKFLVLFFIRSLEKFELKSKLLGGEKGYTVSSHVLFPKL